MSHAKLHTPEQAVSLVHVLLVHKADMHIQGADETRLQVATSEGHVEVAQLLLEHGAEKE